MITTAAPASPPTVDPPTAARVRRPSSTSPTQRSLKFLRGHGMLCQVVEHWNAFDRKRHDLFGIIDILALAEDGVVLAIQTTSSSGVSARAKKIAESPNIDRIRKCDWRVQIHGWRKNSKGKWVLRVVDCS